MAGQRERKLERKRRRREFLRRINYVEYQASKDNSMTRRRDRIARRGKKKKEKKKKEKEKKERKKKKKTETETDGDQNFAKTQNTKTGCKSDSGNLGKREVFELPKAGELLSPKHKHILIRKKIKKENKKSSLHSAQLQ